MPFQLVYTGKGFTMDAHDHQEMFQNNNFRRPYLDNRSHTLKRSRDHFDNQRQEEIVCHHPPSHYDNPTKRFKEMQSGSRGDVTYSGTSKANNGLSLLSNNKSDDEISLAEERPVLNGTIPIPRHSSFSPHRQHGTNSTVMNVTADYQPMNSLLGNLHLMKRRTRQLDFQQQQSQLPQDFSRSTKAPNYHHHHHHHSHSHHSMISPTRKGADPQQKESHRPPKKVMSLPVHSNIY